MITEEQQAERVAECAKYATLEGTALDGGANHGLVTREMLKYWDKVIAFEPEPDNMATLISNLASWGLDPYVDLHQAGLWSDDGGCEVVMPPKRHSHVSWCIQPGGDIPTVTIDSLELDDLNFLKLDLEGAEWHALSSATETLERCKPVVMIEEDPMHSLKRYGISGDAARRLLLDMGYEHFGTMRRDSFFRWRG